MGKKVNKEVNCEVCGAQSYRTGGKTLWRTYGVFICSQCKCNPAWGEAEILHKNADLGVPKPVARMRMAKRVSIKYYTKKLFTYWLNHPQHNKHEEDYFRRIKCISA